jgi:TP901 family phage tail tape measure protein
MPSNFAVATKYTAIDGLTAAHNKMGLSADKLGKRIRRTTAESNAAMKGMGATAKGVFLGGAMMYGTMALRQGIGGLGDEMLELDSALTMAGAKFPVPVKRGTAGMKALEDAARGVGATTKFTAAEAAQGLDFLAMAGFNAQQSMSALPGLAQLATAANLDLARASDIASDALGAFGLMTKDPAELSKNLTRVNDVFAKTVTTSNTTMETLFDTMKASGPIVKTAGSDIETFASMAGILGSASIKGGDAGTVLKNMFLRLAGPVPKASKLLGSLGVTTKDSSGNMRDMFDIMNDLRGATKGMGTAQRSAAMDTLFGKYAVAGANVLLDTSDETLRGYRDSLYGAGGAAKDMAGDINKSLINRLLVLKSALTGKGLDIVSKLTGGRDPGEALDKLTKWVGRIDIDKVIQFGKSLGTVAAAFAAFKTVGMAASMIGSVGTIAAGLSNPVGMAALAVGGLAAAAYASGVDMKKLGDDIGAMFVPTLNNMGSVLQNVTGLFSDNSTGIKGAVEWLAKYEAGVIALPLEWFSAALSNVVGIARIGIETFNVVTGGVGAMKDAITGAGNALLEKLPFLKSFLEIVKTIAEKYGDILGKIWGGGFIKDAVNFVTGGAVDTAQRNVQMRDNRGNTDYMSAINSMRAQNFQGNVGQSVMPPLMVNGKSETTVNLQISGLPQGMTAEATSPNRTAPPVNMALAGAR